MGLELRQRRDLIALLCRVAWADGSVAQAERAHLHDILERVGAGAVSREELDAWLRSGPPRVQGTLPMAAKDLFVQEAMRVIAADRNIDPAEMTALRDVINYYFTRLDELMVG